LTFHFVNFVIKKKKKKKKKIQITIIKIFTPCKNIYDKCNLKLKKNKIIKKIDLYFLSNLVKAKEYIIFNCNNKE